jgi:hypothetical protein
MKINSEDRNTLERLEEKLWREKTRFDIQRMDELIAPDFSGHYPFKEGQVQGIVYNKFEVVHLRKGSQYQTKSLKYLSEQGLMEVTENFAILWQEARKYNGEKPSSASTMLETQRLESDLTGTQQYLPPSTELPDSDDIPVDNEDQNWIPNVLLMLLKNMWADSRTERLCANELIGSSG